MMANLFNGISILFNNISVFFEAIQPIITVLGVAAAVWWFIVRRARAPKANLGHQVAFQDLGEEVYVGVTVVIENTGEVLLRPDMKAEPKSAVAVEELSPYLKSKKVSQEKSPEYVMKNLGIRTFPLDLKIEPKETHAVLFEFIIQKSTKSIKVYSFLRNGYNKKVGWSKTTIHEVKV